MGREQIKMGREPFQTGRELFLFAPVPLEHIKKRNLPLLTQEEVSHEKIEKKIENNFFF
jgi:hypothetical protein